jgi:hypothetical protein
MKFRYRAHETVVHDGPWTHARLPLLAFVNWHEVWYRDFAIEVNVLGHWTPAHVALATEIVPTAA